jgi:DNA-binding transcriptional MerR regulator
MGTNLLLSQWFTSKEMVALTGATYRQIDYWCRKGLIPGHTEPVGSGGRRRFSEEDLRRARLILLASRLSTKPLVEVVAILEHEFMLQNMDREVRALGMGEAG